MTDVPLIQAAAAATPQQFALALSDPSFGGEPFTILLTYDGDLEQPWSRFDIPRFISAVAVRDPEDALRPTDCGYVLLSENGDLYFVGDALEGGIVHNAIPGTQTEKGTVSTSLGTLVLHAEHAVVAGASDVRLYDGKNWREVTPDAGTDDLHGAPIWACFPSSDDKTLLFSISRPSLDRIWLQPGDPEWREDMSAEDRLEIEQRGQTAFTTLQPQITAGYLDTTGAWHPLPTEPRAMPQASYADDATTWLVGAKA
ncbi:hypothetical protein [Tateyamaria sp. syn59]|uniref:hypothetical protein n=1 Tax=Tateyamaria sp. syn59 TaxID=2576942 RepID=UPI0011BE3F0D|nr:hypothetical protein [Tateyamaria sp. syn59]